MSNDASIIQPFGSLVSSRLGLAEQTRHKSVGALNRLLAHTMALRDLYKKCHWQTSGPTFYELHLLFDKVAEETDEYVDLIAERIVQLGGFAEGTLAVAAKRTSLKEYPLSLISGREHADYLSKAIAAAGKQVRAAIDSTAEIGDTGTADVLTEISRGLDKSLWMVESHLQEK